MPLTVVAFASYLTRGREWRDEDHSALKFIKAIKGKHFNGYGHVPVRGFRHKFDLATRLHTHTYFSWLAADHLVAKRWVSKKYTINLVPIPSSDAVKGAKFDRFPARDIAKALQRELKAKGVTAQVVDILRWTSAKTPSHAGGTRDPHELYRALSVTAGISEDADYLMVDDVCTAGGHLRACKRRLDEAGAKVYRAICAGRTVQTPPENAFGVFTEEFDDLGDPWDF